jgi:hypothetical protein
MSTSNQLEDFVNFLWPSKKTLTLTRSTIFVGEDVAVVQTVAAVTEAIAPAPAPLASAAAAAAAAAASTEVVTIHSQRSSLSQTPEEDEEDEEEESSPSRTTRGTSSKHRRQKLVMMMEEQKKPEAVEAAEDSFHRLSSAVASGVKIKVCIVQIHSQK